MEPPHDSLSHRHQPDRLVSRRSLLGWSAAGTFSAAAWLFTTRTVNGNVSPDRVNASAGSVLFEDTFAGHSLNQKYWNPYICDNDSHGWPWNMQTSIAVPSSAMSREHGFNASYNLPRAIALNGGLNLNAYRGTQATGYSATGSVICSRPTSNDFGSGSVDTTGFTFADARVEVRAKMPVLTSGQWPAIWFLPASGSDGGEIDLFEGGFLDKKINASRLMAVKLFAGDNKQQFLDCRTDLSANFHTYAMEYRQGTSVKFFFDSKNVFTYTHDVPVGRYFIILSNSIASAQTASWHTQVSKYTPANNLMRVSYVRVLAL